MRKSKFVSVKCSCGNEQTIFGCASTVVKCLKCDKEIVRPTGGKANIHTKILKVLE